MNLTPLFSQRKNSIYLLRFRLRSTTVNAIFRVTKPSTLNPQLSTILSKLSFYPFRHPTILIADNGIFQKDSMK